MTDFDLELACMQAQVLRDDLADACEELDVASSVIRYLVRQLVTADDAPLWEPRP